MGKAPTNNKKLLKELTTKRKRLEGELVEALKREGKDPYIEVKVGKSQAHGKRVKYEDAPDVVLAHFFLVLDIKAKEEAV